MLARSALTALLSLMLVIQGCASPTSAEGDTGDDEAIGSAAQAEVIADRLAGGQQLLRGQSLQSSNLVYTFTLQDDGNLVLQGPGGALWASNTAGSTVWTAVMHSDGNFVLYGDDNRPVWASNTWNHPATSLVVQDDGNVVLYQYGSRAIWATGTSQ